MIEAQGLSKRYGATDAVQSLTFNVRSSMVTGFLGPNGSGKSTTMRLILGLDTPDAGHVRIGGRRYRDLRWPLREVGSLLETRDRGMALLAASARRWARALRPGWNARVSSSAPTSRRGQRRSR